LTRIFERTGLNTRLKGFYFGLTQRLKHRPDDELNAWFTNPEQRNPLTEEVYIVPMTELFTAADHGGCDRYEPDPQGQVKPVLRAARNGPALRWGLDAQQNAMIQFAETALKMLHEEDLVAVPAAFHGMAARNYRKFLLEPTLEEAKAYCGYQDAEDQTEAYYRRLGRAYDFRELQAYFRSSFAHHHNEWRQGSLALSPPGLVELARLTVMVEPVVVAR
jgi:hypothetical protein